MRFILLLIVLIPNTLISRDCLDESWKHYSKKDYYEAISSLNSCLNDVITDAEPEEMDYVFRGLSHNYIKLGLIDSALKNTLIALSIEEMNQLEKSETLNELGAIYTEVGLNHQAIYYLKKAYEINLVNENNKSIQKNLNNIAAAFLNLDMLDSADYYLQKSISVSGGNPIIKFEILNNLSLLNFTKSNFDEAKKYSKRSINLLPENMNIHDSLLLVTNYELIMLLSGEMKTLNSIKVYKELESKNKNSTYYADVNYKLSLLEAKSGNVDASFECMNNAVKIYVRLGDIVRARQITRTFLLLTNRNTKSSLYYTEVQLTELQLISYSKQLENDINTRIISDTYISRIENEIFYTKMSLYLTFSILASLLLTTGFVIYRIRNNNQIEKLVNAYNNYLEIIYQLDSKRLKTNLSKINIYMVLDKSFDEKKYFTDLVSEVVDDTNKIRSTAKSGIDFQQTKRLYNGKHTTASKLPVDR